MSKPIVKVLLIEDSPSDAQLLQEHLGQIGDNYYEVTHVERLEHALARLESRSHDVLLLDISLPDSTGFDTFAAIRRAAPNVPVIVLTGSGDEQLGLDTLRRGAQDYLVKGQVDARQIERAIRYAIERHQAEEALQNANLGLGRRVSERTAELQTSNEALQAEIADRKRAEEVLRVNQTELAAIYNHAPMMMCLVDKDLRIRRMNRELLQFVSHPVGENAQPSLGELLGCVNALDHPRGCPFSPRCAACFFPAMIQNTLLSGQGRHRVEGQLQRRRPNGQAAANLLASSAALFLTGEPVILLCLEDITQQKLAEERLREQATLLDIAPDAIGVLDLTGCIRYWNQGAERIYGWTAQEALGQSFDWLIQQEPTPELAAAKIQVLQTGSWVGELQHINKAGQRLVVRSSRTLVRDPQVRTESVLMVNTDITEPKKIEAQLLRMQRVESVGRLANGLAHDLNNVLSSVLMVADLLRDRLAAPEDQELLTLLKSGFQRGSNILKQLLIYSRGVESQRAPLNLRDLVHEELRIMRETFPKSILIQLRLPEDLWTVIGDVTQLHQVLLNLSVNARDAMPAGGTLSLNLENLEIDAASADGNPEAKPGAYVVLEVADTGMGIAPGIMDKIFDPFFTTKELGQGTGLGLSTVLGITKSHGGFIEVHSQVGRGTQFKIYLPASKMTPLAKANDPSVASKTGLGELILVVDDEACIRQATKKYCERKGYRVVTANDGYAALEVYAKRKAEIKIILLDMWMPFMDGLTTIQELQKLGSHIPIIAASGLPESGTDAFNASPAVKSFLQKPWSPDQLLAAIQKAVQQGAS